MNTSRVALITAIKMRLVASAEVPELIAEVRIEFSDGCLLDCCSAYRTSEIVLPIVALRIDFRRRWVSTDSTAARSANAIRIGIPYQRARNSVIRTMSDADTTQAAIAAFLDTHYSHAHVNDVGPLLGRLASLRDAEPAEEIALREWNLAVSAALTGQASAVR